MKTLIIGQDDVVRLLPMEECIALMEQTFVRLAASGAVIYPRSKVEIDDQKILGFMPAYFPAIDKAGIKVTTVYPGNSGTKYHVHQGAVLLFETENGFLQAVLDAAEITTIRTGAASGLATKLLARENAGDLAVIGAGTQGSCHLEAMMKVRSIRKVKVYDYFPARAAEFARREALVHKIDIEVSSTVQEAVEKADLICIATPAREPVLRGEWLSPGVHINSVGFGGPASRELDTDLLSRARIFVDYRETILHDCGDLLLPLKAGEIKECSILGGLGDILAGSVEGRVKADDITLFKSAGVAVQDLAVADYVYQKALKQGAGCSVTLGGYNLNEQA
jgi:alanine dehydrogenase